MPYGGLGSVDFVLNYVGRQAENEVTQSQTHAYFDLLTTGPNLIIYWPFIPTTIQKFPTLKNNISYSL